MGRWGDGEMGRWGDGGQGGKKVLHMNVTWYQNSKFKIQNSRWLRRWGTFTNLGRSGGEVWVNILLYLDFFDPTAISGLHGTIRG